MSLLYILLHHPCYSIDFVDIWTHAGDGWVMLLLRIFSFLQSSCFSLDIVTKEGWSQRLRCWPLHQWTPWSSSWLFRMLFHKSRSSSRMATSFFWSYDLCCWLVLLRFFLIPRHIWHVSRAWSGSVWMWHMHAHSCVHTDDLHDSLF